MAQSMYRIYVSGRFRLTCPKGTEIAISSAKVQGLLALLAVDTEMTRPRTWLQDKLWSDRSLEMRLNSLRQALYQVRKLFGDDADILSASRSLVSLDTTRIEMVRDDEMEFLEGLNVKDREFERWLASERGQAEAPEMEIPKRPRIHAPRTNTLNHSTRRGLAIDFINDPKTVLGQEEIRFGDLLQKSVREVIDFEPAILDAPNARAEDVLTLGIHAFPVSVGQIALRLAIYDGPSTTAVWADNAQAPISGQSPAYPSAFLSLCHRTSAAVIDRLCRNGIGRAMSDDANVFAGAGLRQMYSMLPGSIGQAKKMFKRANEISPRGLYHALRAQLAVIEFVETAGSNRQELGELADDLCTKAMAEEGSNSNVLSCIAHARLVFDDDQTTSSELSRLAVMSNPSNPLAWSTLAITLISQGEAEQAARAAEKSRDLSRETFYRYWTEFQFATTAVALHDYPSAIRHAERSRALNPRYRPAIRYLIGLYAKTGQLEASRKMMERLRRMEPEASADRFLFDESYPVSMMRSAGLVEQDSFQSL